MTRTLVKVCIAAALVVAPSPARSEDALRLPPMPAVEQPANWQEITDYIDRYAGTWETHLVTRKFKFLPVELKGKLVASVIGGRWVITDMDGGGRFAGHGILGFDGTKWIAIWVDDKAAEMYHYEGKRTAKGVRLETRGATQPYAKGEQERRVDEWLGPDEYVSHFIKDTDEGSPQEFMTITHKRLSRSSEPLASNSVR